MKKLIGKKEMEDALKRLDKLTQDEARMAATETLKLTHVLADNQVIESLRTWVTPPDLSTTHTIDCNIQHDGSAQWFFRSECFRNRNPLALSCGSMASVRSPKSISESVLTTIHALSGLREEHPLVSHRSTLFPGETNLRCRVALQSFRISKHHVKQG